MEVNRIYNEDCYEILRLMPDGSVDLFLQDTPFGVTRNGWDIPPDFKKMWPEWLRVGKPNCAFVFFAQQPFTTDLINSMRKYFRYDIVWQKTSPKGFYNASRMPLRDHETILIFYRKQPTYNPQKTTGHPRKVSTAHHKRNSVRSTNYGTAELKTYDSTERFPKSVWTFPQDTQKSKDHPTQKPVGLIRQAVRTYSNPGEIVFDGYSGSGTTGEACILEDRNFILCETDPISYNKSVTRIESVFQKKIAA